MSDRLITDRAIPRGSLGDLEAFIYFGAAYDCRRGHCPSCEAGYVADHGRGSVSMNWVVRGHDFVVEWNVYTGFAHSSTPPERESALLFRPTPPASVNYHSTRPVWEGATPGRPCAWFEGEPPCYFDGTYLVDDLWHLFTDQGDEAAWAWLVTRWHDWHREREATNR